MQGGQPLNQAKRNRPFSRISSKMVQAALKGVKNIFL